MHLNFLLFRNAGIPHSIKSKSARIPMYLENCIQKKDTISLTQKIQDIRENQSSEMNETVTNVCNAIQAGLVGGMRKRLFAEAPLLAHILCFANDPILFHKPL